MRAAMFGGSFNPVHLGHEKLVNAVINECGLDKVIIMPTFSTPLKDNSEFADSKHRLRMCELAFEHTDRVEVSDLEIKRQGKSYTYLTLNSLKELYDELFLVVGADMFLTLDKWKRPDEIFRAATIIAVPRNCDDNDLTEQAQKLSKLGCKSVILNHTVMDVSSTQIRNAIRAGESADKLLNKKVYEYIKTNRLYGV